MYSAKTNHLRMLAMLFVLMPGSVPAFDFVVEPEPRVKGAVIRRTGIQHPTPDHAGGNRIQVAGATPELRLDGLSLSRGVAHLGETVEAIAVIENTGVVGAKNVTVRFSLGATQIGQDYVIDIGARSRIEVSILFKARPEGKQDFVVAADPDNRIAESNESNNSGKRTLGIISLPRALSNTSTMPARDKVESPKIEILARGKIVQPVAKPELGDQPSEPAAKNDEKPTMRDTANGPRMSPAPTMAAASSPPPVETSLQKPNLVGKVETIQGTHYFDGITLHVKVTNKDKEKRANPSMLGIYLKPASGRRDKSWLVKLPVKGLKPGETTILDVPWLKAAAHTPRQGLYVAEVDIENDVDEGQGGERDNVSNPFRLAVINRPPDLPAPATATPSPASGSSLRSAQTAPKIQVNFPGKGAELYMGETYVIQWQAGGFRNSESRIQINLVELGAGRTEWGIGAPGVAIDTGRYSWTVPSKPTLFGRYFLVLTDRVSGVMGHSGLFEIMPRFVPKFKRRVNAEAETTIKADLAIASAGFKNGRLGFALRNLGPDPVPAYVIARIKFRAYYIKSVPIMRADDYEICETNLWRKLLPQKERAVMLGYDPECGHGTLSEDERFVFAIIRVETPSLVDVNFEDPDLSNNSYKVRYPNPA